ncbi:hypothetical protein ACQ27_gp077 [Klebsiella phage K64-1]|nr:hypothetical protein ACQ27_gp077 [Klebsiella phage K64-1]
MNTRFTNKELLLVPLADILAG